MGPEQLPPVDGTHGESASVKKSDEDVVNWHHYELGDTYALPFHWDRYLFRLVCYMETSLIRESVKQKIFDMKMIENLRDGIRSEARDYMLSLGEHGRRSISEIPESITPTPKSYRDATSPTPKRKPTATNKVEQSENADARQLSEMDVEHTVAETLMIARLLHSMICRAKTLTQTPLKLRRMRTKGSRKL